MKRLVWRVSGKLVSSNDVKMQILMTQDSSFHFGGEKLG
jgi:hypothetical protein